MTAFSQTDNSNVMHQTASHDPAVSVEDLTIIADDGYPLAVRYFPAPGAPTHVVIINSATGVRQQFYSAFAHYLQAQGMAVFTYDYRGIGQSRRQRLAHLRATMNDWGEKDLSAVIDYVSAHFGQPLTVIGHSLGGQIIGMSAAARKASRIVMIGSQTPYWKHYAGWMRFKVWQLWHVMIPVLTTAAGYFPAARLGLFEDLPAGAARQWARWGKNRNYLFDEFPHHRKNYQALRQPALVFSFTDDAIAPKKAVDDLLHFYANLDLVHLHLHPREVNLRRIGHFSFFRKKTGMIFWHQLAGWVKGTAPHTNALLTAESHRPIITKAPQK